jgi:pimeloyl-ACP methyl ester carboxylesterase
MSPRRGRTKRLLRYAAGALAASLAGASAVLGAVEARALSADLAQPPLSGVMVATDDGRFRVDCAGPRRTAPGTPVVVLEAGLGESGYTWAEVHHLLADQVRVCSYDRAGYGSSAPGDGPRTATRLAEELHGVLAAKEVSGPLVLVAHSLGSFVAREYASLHPDDVVALVLVDPTNDAAAAEAPVLPALLDATVQGAVARLGLARGSIGETLTTDHRGHLPKIVREHAPRLYQARSVDAMFAELAASTESARALETRGLAVPATVLLSAEAAEADADHFERLGDDVLVVRTRVPDHHIHYRDPEVVVDETLRLVERSSSTGSTVEVGG